MLLSLSVKFLKSIEFALAVSKVCWFVVGLLSLFWLAPASWSTTSAWSMASSSPRVSSLSSELEKLNFFTLGGKFLWYEKSTAVCCGLGWAVGKKVWDDYEQLLREVFSIFCGPKKRIKTVFWKHCSVRTEKLHRKKVKKKYFLGGKIFFFRKTFFF